MTTITNLPTTREQEIRELVDMTKSTGYSFRLMNTKGYIALVFYSGGKFIHSNKGTHVGSESAEIFTAELIKEIENEGLTVEA